MLSRLKLVICSVCGIFLLMVNSVHSQSNSTYWQQEVAYTMDIVMDVEKNTFTGNQIIKYKNNSPEVLHKAFFHLYLNAFQPGSAMDIRARAIVNVDPRMQPIYNLSEDEIGYQRIGKLTQDGKKLDYEVVGTILEVKLAHPIKPGQTTTFVMTYTAQVPVMIRRMGRDNKEGIRYSMAQWYPKLCVYDRKGWHADPYIGQEYYSDFGTYDVSITIDASYTVAASGILKNAKEIGHGYGRQPQQHQEVLKWQFLADKVHDFVWAADPGYQHDQHKAAGGIQLHAFYLDKDYAETWKELLPIMEEAIRFASKNYGKFPYPTYSFIQGGDGGMEYAMATLITGNRPLTSLVGVSVHEMMHTWYQMVLGFNERYYYWMDEGFVQYAAEQVMNHLRAMELIPGEPIELPYEGFYKRYARLVNAGVEEPMSTHADHFGSYPSYSTSAYVKGAIFLNQLEYVIGEPAFDQGMLDFFDQWKFKHPDDVDFLRVMEAVADLELDWYRDYWVNSTKWIDYAIDTVYGNSEETIIYLRRDGKMPMPVDVQVVTSDGDEEFFTIPLDIMRGHKAEKAPDGAPFVVLPDWQWVHPYYYFSLPYRFDEIRSVSIDPSQRLADLNELNDSWPFPEGDEENE